MKMGTRLHHVSGFSADDLSFLQLRFPEDLGFRPDNADSWIWHRRGKKDRALLGWSRWISGLWYSGKVLFACMSRGRIFRFGSIGANEKEDDYHVDELPAALMGVWGLDESHVYTWADRDRETGVMFRWNGKKWTEMPSPWGVLEVRGSAEDDLWAVGRRGLIAHWNGKKWLKSKPLGRGDLEAVYIVDEKEAWAVDTDGQLLRRDGRKWVVEASAPCPLYAVAKWKGELWIGAGEKGGVARLVGDRILSVESKLHAFAFDARRDLLASCYGAIAVTSDGKKWTTPFDGSKCLKAISKTAPLWK